MAQRRTLLSLVSVETMELIKSPLKIDSIVNCLVMFALLRHQYPAVTYLDSIGKFGLRA